jgi:hypothetical protein
MKKEILFIAALILLVAFCMNSPAQEIDIEKHSGYINLDNIPVPKSAGKVTDVNIGPGLLKIASTASQEDEDLGKVLSGIFSIRVISFEVDSSGTDELLPYIEKIEKKLKAEQWENVVKVRDGEERTRVCMKITDGKAVGLFVMSIEPGDEVTFINIVGGNLDLAKIGSLGLGVEGSALDSLKNLKY